MGRLFTSVHCQQHGRDALRTHLHVRLHSQEPATRPERRGSMVSGGASALRSSALQRWQRVASWWAGEAQESLQDGVDNARCGLGQVTYESD